MEPARPLHRSLALLALWGTLALLLGPMRGAWFAVIDDHHIVRLAGDDGRVSAREATEGALGWRSDSDGRFRPLFWILWNLEALRAGTDPSRWHLDRLLLALATATGLYLAAEAVLPPLLAALAAFAFFCGFQNEIWMRLRAQEAFGAMLMSAGLALVARRLAKDRAGPAALLPGLVLLGLAGLAKESFAPLLPEALVYALVVHPRLADAPARPWMRRDGIALLALMLGSAAIGAAIVYARAVHGPLYAGPTSVRSFAGNAWRHLWLLTKDSGWPVPVAAAGVCLAWTRAERKAWIATGVALLAGAVLWLVPQWVVYSAGSIEGRYLVPGCTFAVWAAAIGLRTLWERRAFALLAVSVASLLGFDAKWVGRDRGVAIARARATQEHRAAVESVARAREAEPGLAIVFRSEDPFDLERVDSAWWFLSARLGPGFRPFLLATDERRSRSEAALGDTLAAFQQARSEGRENAFQAWSSYAGGPDGCLEVVFHADASRAACRRQVVFPSPDPGA